MTDPTNDAPTTPDASTPDWVDTAEYTWDRTHPRWDRGRTDLQICNDDGILEDALTWDDARRNLARDYTPDDEAWIEAPDEDEEDDDDDEEDADDEDA